MNQYPKVKILFDRRKEARQKKTVSVEIEIYFEGKRKWISTGVRIEAKNWNKIHKVVGRADALDLNLKIDSVQDFVLTYIRRLMIEKREFSWTCFNTAINQSKNQNSFINFVESKLKDRKDITKGTYKNHLKFLNLLKEYNTILEFEDLTRNKIHEFDCWIRNRREYKQSTIAEYHKYMKIYVNSAIREEIITSNPYDGIKIEKGRHRMRKYLTQCELSRISEVHLPTDSLKKVRDLFLFQCYTGLSYSDMAKFEYSRIEEKDGRFVYHEERQKTKEIFYIILLPIAMEILRKYGLKLPIISNVQYNMRLKVVADAAGIDKRLTSHMGRHTYATMCLNAGIPIEVLADMLGHSDIKTTQIYAKLVNKTVENAYEQLQKKLEENSGLTKE